MPSDPTNSSVGIQPVRFDQAVADQLVAALRELHQQAVSAYRADAEMAGSARVEWLGLTRRWFDQRHEDLQQGIRRLGTDARELADQVRRAQQVALDLQAERDALLARLWTQQASVEANGS